MTCGPTTSLNPYALTSMNVADPTPTSVYVRIPALFWRISRSMPMSEDRASARASRQRMSTSCIRLCEVLPKKAPWSAGTSSILLGGRRDGVRSQTMASRTKQKEEARERRLAEERARAAQAQRRRRFQMLGGAVIVAAAVVAVAIAISSGGSSSPHISKVKTQNVHGKKSF